MESCALNIRHITKEYRLYASEKDRLKEAFHPFRKCYHKKFYALNDVSFSIPKGENVGIIGANGAGKSTLLKIITQVLKPTRGEVVADGKIAALLELGAGFNPDYTGIENIRLNGTLMGYSEEEIEKKMPNIIDFADIGDFINQPVKAYSSGMFVRLAFATQIFSDPDILIVDEALSVGDIRFQQKCFRAMESVMRDKTVLLVTHDTAAVTRFCSRVIWINQGKIAYDGEVPEGLKKYQGFLIDRTIQEKGTEGFYSEQNNCVLREQKSSDLKMIPTVEGISSKGTGDARITHCGLFDARLQILENAEPGQTVQYIAKAHFLKSVQCPIFGITVKDRLGNIIFSVNTEMLGMRLPEENGCVEYRLKFQLPQLNKGEYSISPAVANGYQNDHIQLCWLDDASVFRVTDRKYDLPGFFYLDKGEIFVFNTKNFY